MPGETSRDEGLRHLQRGLALERVHRHVEAVSEYRQALLHNPLLPEAHDALALHYQRSGLLAKAADELQAVVNLSGDFVAYFNLGFVLVELARYDEALDIFGRCLRLHPGDTATHFEIAHVHVLRGNFSVALEHLRRLLPAFADDWEVHSLLGRCYLGLRRYDEATEAFTKALTCAPDQDAQISLFDRINAVERHREFRALQGTKDQFYADEGVVYLGSAQDDGLYAGALQDYHFTYHDVGITVRRLLALIQGYRWQFSVVVAVDRMAEPLALALGQLLELPVRPPAALTADDSALLVLAVAHEAELLQLTIERAPCLNVAFCLGLNWLRHSRLYPDVIGVAAQCSSSVPWEAELRRLWSEAAGSAPIGSCIARACQQILSAISETPPESNLPSQVRYYTRTHRRLCFATPLPVPPA
ncbi:MAG: tetratricopeptide repeat protein [Chloroflexaceae bacterium]|jgi:tetratricopeptide (TPR) repeat protein|nr:tetratricopeptide repeat protein [Chloroflexaceae bacterium]